MSSKDKTPAPTVVETVRTQTEQAAALAGIDGQTRLADPRTNPATRSHADTLRTDQLTRALDAEHSRLLRRHRVEDRRAAEAEETLAAIALARQAASPARSVRALHTGRRLYSRVAMAASVALAVGSSLGVEAAAQRLNAPDGTGYFAEVGLTGLATAAILYRSHLAEHRGVLVAQSWQSRSLWALMTVPLAASVAANLGTVNVIGALCAVGAAAFALLACVVADRSAAAMQTRVDEVSAEDEDAIRATAMGEDLFAPVVDERLDDGEDAQEPSPGPVRRPDERDRPLTRTREDDAVPSEGQERELPGEVDAVTTAARAGVDDLAAWLAGQEPPEEGAAPTVSPEPEDGPSGAARDLPDVPEERAHFDGQGGHIDPDQDEPAETGQTVQDASQVLAAAEARRAVGAATRGRIAEYLADHPRASNSAVASALDLSTATVKRHRRELRNRGGER